MACGGPSQPLPTVLMSVWSWREGAGGSREELQLQLSVGPENPGDFRLSARAPARGPGSVVVAEFRLRDISYDLKTPRCHQLTVLEDPTTFLNFNFEDEREAQKWWTVVSSSLREAQKAMKSQGNTSGMKPPVPNKPRSPPNVGEPCSPEGDLAVPLASLGTKEELAQRLSRCVESGDQKLAAQYAAELAKHRVPVHVQLRQACYPRSEICMKVGVEDAKASVNITTYVHSHTTIAMLKQQIFKDYQFHPSIQRWIIGQCLCSDDRTVVSYGITRDGDTAFLYLLGAKQAKLTKQDVFKNNLHQAPSHLPDWGLEKPPKASTLPAPKTGQKPPKAESMDTPGHLNPVLNTPPSPAQVGWSCPACTFFNVPTRPGCEICCSDRPADYVVPEWYKPDESERRRIQQENDGLQQYKKEKGRREDKSSSQHKIQRSLSEDFEILST